MNAPLEKLSNACKNVAYLADLPPSELVSNSEWRRVVTELDAALVPYRDITPWQKTVEAIAKLVSGPADGNFVEHVRAICDGAKRLTEERDAARENFLKARDARDAALNELDRLRRSAVTLHEKQDGIWLGVHASSTGRSALVLLEQHGWGRLVRQTFADYFAERKK